MSNVLILDDQDEWITFVKSALRNGVLQNCTLHTTRTFSQAIAIVRSVSLDVAVLDFRLQEAGPQGHVSGLDVASVIRKEQPTAAILLLTMADDDKIRRACDALHVTVIEKGRGDVEAELVREIRDAIECAVRKPGSC